ncbi:MFS transporter [Pseudomonas sp. REP124]|uniref:MFS transporter n=1 Tax=Pseudomonas sp. REP124 TaxID=2875731 RepID=UPI001CCAE6F7|nr:MFS transporter [Pseudomonas sp. REP124]MBZ9781475.1 MFS transporter [Pseudomonas sp. REP124]
MTPTQWRGIGLCMFFNVVDGLDAMVMAFTGAAVAAQWGLSGIELGMLLSASLVGMALGSMFAAPAADRHGRRPLLIAGLSVSGLCMVLTFWSQGLFSLMLLRGLTGIGLGAVLVGANVLTFEHASAHRRGLAIALQSLSFALGVSLGGVLAHVFNDHLGWRYVFLAGGLITFVATLAGACWLRESQAFLTMRSECAGPQAADDCVQPPHSRADYRQLFSPGQWQQTASLAMAFFLIMFGFYFVMSWTPTLMTYNGFTEKQSAVGGILLSAGGMLGALLMGLGADRFGSRRLLLGFLLLNAILMTFMVPVSAQWSLAILIGFSTGLLLNGAIAALYTLAPQAFVTSIRTSGVGLVLGLGRVGAILSPAVAGLLLDARWSAQGLFTFFAGSQLLAALLVWRGGKTG